MYIFKQDLSYRIVSRISDVIKKKTILLNVHYFSLAYIEVVILIALVFTSIWWVLCSVIIKPVHLVLNHITNVSVEHSFLIRLLFENIFGSNLFDINLNFKNLG